MYKNFVSDYFEEGFSIDKIDDYVEYWHNHDTNITLCEFLGFTDEEYREWMMYGNNVVRDILYRRRNAINYNNGAKGDKTMVPNNDMIRMLTETEKVSQGEEDLLFPLITTCPKGGLSNNWKKMHHIPLKATTKNGHNIIRIKQDCYSSRRRKKQKKRDRRKERGEVDTTC